MPVIDTERRATRSALRYRPIDTDLIQPVPAVSRTRRVRSDVRMATASAAPDGLDLGEQAPSRRTNAPIPQRPAPPARTKRRVHLPLFMIFGLIAMIFLWVGISQVVTWGTNELNTLKYGDPRTFQIDAVVGNGDSAQHPSHFLAINLHGAITILEFPAGDSGRARVLATTSVLGQNADQAVVTLTFIDVNHNGRPDMLIDIDGVESVLINDQGTFHPPTPAEQQQILHALQQ